MYRKLQRVKYQIGDKLTHHPCQDKESALKIKLGKLIRSERLFSTREGQHTQIPHQKNWTGLCFQHNFWAIVCFPCSFPIMPEKLRVKSQQNKEAIIICFCFLQKEKQKIICWSKSELWREWKKDWVYFQYWRWKF